MSMLCLTLFLRVWKPATIWTNTAGKLQGRRANAPAATAAQ
jgi:lactate permease